MTNLIIQEPEYEATFSRDPKGGRITWSVEMHELFGVEPGEFDGTLEDFLRRVHPGDRARVERTVEAIGSRPGYFSDELRIVRPDGAIRRIRVFGEALEGADGQIMIITGAAEDISELDVHKPELAAELGLR